MSLFGIRKRKLLGTLLVTLQFGLLAGLAALASAKVMRGAFPLSSVILAGASVALAIWALIHNQPGNFNIRPTPKTWGTLVTTGPYRWIRHPMYTSVLMGGAALALMANPPFGWIAWFALAVVLVVKSIIEERWMREQHPDYDDYRLESKRFVPWLW